MKTKYESGRSMVEMLGVLAVVGVLSVGAIAGYNYAMRSHRANEMINAVSTLYTTGLSQKGGDGTGELDYVTAVGELPAGAKGLVYNDDTTVTLDIADTNNCATVKSKLGEKVVEGDCGTLDAESGAYTLVVAMGESGNPSVKVWSDDEINKAWDNGNEEGLGRECSPSQPCSVIDLDGYDSGYCDRGVCGCEWGPFGGCLDGPDKGKCQGVGLSGCPCFECPSGSRCVTSAGICVAENSLWN